MRFGAEEAFEEIKGNKRRRRRRRCGGIAIWWTRPIDRKLMS
jgi:hypothetical protein